MRLHSPCMSLHWARAGMKSDTPCSTQGKNVWSGPDPALTGVIQGLDCKGRGRGMFYHPELPDNGLISLHLTVSLILNPKGKERSPYLYPLTSTPKYYIFKEIYSDSLAKCDHSPFSPLCMSPIEFQLCFMCSSFCSTHILQVFEKVGYFCT